MLLFSCAAEKDLKWIRRDGLVRGGDGLPALWTTLEDARQACKKRERVLVIQSDVPAPQRIAPEAVRNLTPYRPARPISAAGGYVVRAGREEAEVLLIYRRGFWDLPKGKLDPGETIEACAVREVQEEIGIQQLHLLAPLGTTLHGYPEGDKYRVKTTYWFLMQTPETDFTPQAEEDIELVAWVPLSEARNRLGFDTLRHHLQQVEDRLRASATRDTPLP